LFDAALSERSRFDMQRNVTINISSDSLLLCSNRTRLSVFCLVHALTTALCFFLGLLFSACGAGVPDPQAAPQMTHGDTSESDSDTKTKTDPSEDKEFADYSGRAWKPSSVERMKRFLLNRGDGLVGTYVSGLTDELAATLERQIRDRDLAFFALMVMQSEYRYDVGDRQLDEFASGIAKITDAELLQLSHADIKDLRSSALLLMDTVRAVNLMYTGRLLLARVSARDLSVEDGRVLVKELLMEAKKIDRTYDAMEKELGAENLPRLLANVAFRERFWSSLRSIKYYAELMASENPCFEAYYSDELIEYLWETWGPEVKGSLCRGPHGHRYIDTVSFSELDKSGVSKLDVHVPRKGESSRAAYPIGRWNDRIIISISDRQSRSSYMELNEKTLRLIPISISDKGDIRSLAENDVALFALMTNADGNYLAQKLKTGGEWTFEKLPECGGERGPCHIVAEGSRVFAVDHNKIIFRSPDGTWDDIPITSFFGDKSLRGRLSAALIQGDNLFLGYNRGEFGGGLVRLRLSDNQRRPIESGEFLRQMIISDIVETSDGTAWFIADEDRLGCSGLFIYRGGRFEAVVYQSSASARDGRPSRFYWFETEPRFFVPIQGSMTHLAEGSDGSVYLLFPKLGITKLADDHLELVIEVSLDDEWTIGERNYATYPDNLFVLPSGDFLIGTSVGLLLLQKAARGWTSRWLHIPKDAKR
jgi:hypothetical protein